VTSPWAAFDGNDIRPLGACANPSVRSVPSRAFFRPASRAGSFTSDSWRHKDPNVGAARLCCGPDRTPRVDKGTR
jgi:hypothetical protein